MKQCCGQLRNVESASGADLEPIRTETSRARQERERIVKVEWALQKVLREGKMERRRQ